MKTHDYCILFGHHCCCEVTVHNFEQLQKHNPGVPIVPLTQGGPTDLPGCVDVIDMPSRWNTSFVWSAADTFIYRWFQDRTATAKRYIWAEWDMHSRTSMPKFMRTVWGAPVSAPWVVRPGTRWMWWAHIDWLPHAQRQYALGLVPLCTSAYSHEALETICRTVCSDNVFSELRIGTAANAARIPISENYLARGTCGWHPQQGKFTGEETIYHPLKTIPK